MSQELIERLKSDARFIERNRTQTPDQTIAKDILGAIEALASQDKRIAELEQECQLSMATIAEERARADTAESRGRQIGREEAAAWHEAEANRLIAENDAIKAVGGWADTNGRLVPAEAHRISAAAIRNLPTNE